jgi:hypothetical protein
MWIAKISHQSICEPKHLLAVIGVALYFLPSSAEMTATSILSSQWLHEEIALNGFLTQ